MPSKPRSPEPRTKHENNSSQAEKNESLPISGGDDAEIIRWPVQTLQATDHREVGRRAREDERQAAERPSAGTERSGVAAPTLLCDTLQAGCLPRTGSGLAVHTPGPWYVDALSETAGLMIKPDRGQVICELDGHPEMARTIADARLIAAAPELLEAAQYALRSLKYWRDACVQNGEHDSSWVLLQNEIRAAVTKATTGQNAELSGAPREKATSTPEPK